MSRQELTDNTNNNNNDGNNRSERISNVLPASVDYEMFLVVILQRLIKINLPQAIQPT